MEYDIIWRKNVLLDIHQHFSRNWSVYIFSSIIVAWLSYIAIGLNDEVNCASACESEPVVKCFKNRAVCLGKGNWFIVEVNHE